MKPLKLDADSSRTGKLEDIDAPWSRLLHLATWYLPETRYPLVLAGATPSFDFYYLTRGASESCTARSGRERAMVYIGGRMYSMRPRHWRVHSRLPLLLWKTWNCAASPARCSMKSAFRRRIPELIINLMVSMSTRCS